MSGRGRGRIHKPSAGSPVGPTGGAVGGAVGGAAPPDDDHEMDDEESARKKQKEAAERKSGLSYDFFDEVFKLDGNPRQVLIDQKLYVKPNENWFAVKKEEEPEVKNEPLVDKKFAGKQYVTEQIVKEKERWKSLAREEADRFRPSPSPSADASVAGSVFGGSRQSVITAAGRPNRRANASTLSVVSSAIESVGTVQPMAIPDTIMEDVDMTDVKAYFGPDSRHKRQQLPISQYADQIVSVVTLNRVIVIEGATGCGKTTQVPQYIADDCAERGVPFNIVVTQPRRIAAKSISARVAEERDWELGSLVGYQIGMDKSCVSADTRILYVTTGVLLQRLIGSRRLDTYSHIIIDEVHERSIETDLLLLVIKRLMAAQSVSVKIILMSATFEVSQLRDYFTIPIYKDEELVQEVVPAHIKIDERNKPLHIYYLANIRKDLHLVHNPNPSRDIRYHYNSDNDKSAACVTQEAMEVAVHMMELGLKNLDDDSGSRGAVLIFLPGLEEIIELKARLEKSKECALQHWKIYPLHSSIPLDKQNSIFTKTARTERKVILATNIAESSITVPDVSYVIDFCLTKSLVCDVETHIPVLKMEWASKANCQQRAGRAGRVTQGRVYRLVEESFYKTQMPDYSQPELTRSPLDLSILRVKMLEMGSPKELLGLALSPPDLADIYRSVLQLKQVGAFTVKVTERDRIYYDEEDGDITTLGRIMSHLPIDIRLGKLVIMGHAFDCLEDCIIIAACLSTQGMFRKDFAQGLNAYKSRMSWADRSFSDSIAYLNAYKMYKKFEAEFSNDRRMAENWCRQNFLQHKRILEVDYMIGELFTRLARDNIVIPERPNLRRSRHEEELILKVVMCAAFYPNYFTRNEINLKNIPKELSTKDPRTSVSVAGLPANQGPLYAAAIRELFSVCAKRIDIDFEDTKAYLTFLDDTHPLKDAFDNHIPLHLKREPFGGSASSMSCKSESRSDTPMSSTTATSTTDRSMSVSSTLSSSTIKSKRSIKETTMKMAVYVALAMNGHRINKEIPKLNPKFTEKELSRLEKFKESVQSEVLIAFRSHRVSMPHMMPRIRLSRLPMPRLDCTEIEIRITHIEDPTNFYAQYVDEYTRKHLDTLSHFINYDDSFRAIDAESLQVGDIVIAPYFDSKGAQMSGRGRVDSIVYKPAVGIQTKEVESIKVFYLDDGKSLVFDSWQSMTRVTARTNVAFMEIPPLAVHCALSQVNPSPISCIDSTWSKKSINYFRKWTAEHPTYTAKIYSVVNRVVRLELFKNVDRSESFNDMLVNIGFAEKWEESEQSRLNHSSRRSHTSARTDSSLKLEEFKPGVYYPDEALELPTDFYKNEKISNIRTHDKISLRGPFNPLQCSFRGVSRQTSFRKVTVDKDSVNFVVLEPDYLSKHTRLLVSASMGLRQESGNITLRDTTLMPNIRGFPALMSLLFAPRVQLRADDEKQQFVSAICGLGYDGRSFKGYDTEYDSEVIFDSDISREDIIKVNIIRFNITSLLASRQALQEYSEASLAVKQRKIRRYVIELLDRRRRLVDNSRYQPLYRWTDLSGEDVMHPRQSEVEINANILPYCEARQLTEYDWYEDVLKNLNELKKLEKGESCAAFKCVLCALKVYSKSDMLTHIHSDGHRDMADDFAKYCKINEQEVQKQKVFEQNEMECIDEQEEDESCQEVFDVDTDSD